MHYRSHKFFAALSLLPLLAGCVQATRHSNTMVFGTNTNVGLKIGTTTGETPEVLIGYDRKETVIMPLLANTGEKENSRNHLSPCEPDKIFEIDKGGQEVLTAGIAALAAQSSEIHPCLFVATKTDSKGKLISRDSYSVLASFGAQIEGNAKEGSGQVGLAQYFATGVAAQMLASNGGAAVVSVGKAAENSAASPTKVAPAGSEILGVENTKGCGKVQLRNYLSMDLATGERQRRLGNLLAAMNNANLGSSQLDLLRLEQGGSEADRQKLISETLKIEGDANALKDMGECT